ncbi:MAG: T9SS type A sorting domain-containing protein [Bacteroidia bacterium]
MKVIKEGDAQLKVINTSGQIVYAESLYQPAGDFSKVLDLKNLAAGIYTLQYSTQHQTMKKLLVIK